MSVPITDRRRANAISMGVFLIGLAVLMYNHTWWPHITLVIGAALLTKQYFRGRHYDMWITIFVFVGIFLFYNQWIHWSVVLPVMFALGGIYIIFREFAFPLQRTGKEAVEDQREEIEDDKQD